MDKLMKQALDKHKIVKYIPIFIEVMETYKTLLEAENKALHIHSVSGSLPPRQPFIDALVENTECAARDEGIYFADSIRYNEERTDWFDKMIEDYQRQ